MKFRNMIIASGLLLLTSSAIAQEMTPEYQQVLKIVGKTGDFKANVYASQYTDNRRCSALVNARFSCPNTAFRLQLRFLFRTLS